jgi:hypothetical protein
MDVVLRTSRHVIVDHVGDALDIQATGRKVGGHQNLMRAAAKAFQGLQALVLRAIAMETGHAKSRAVQGVCEPIGTVFRPRKHQDTGHCRPRQQRHKQGRLVRG